jgi:hypothetical protein
MPSASVARPGRRTPARPSGIAAIGPARRTRRRVLRAILAAPLTVRLLVATVVVVAVWSAVNWAYQVVRKPTELFFPVSGMLAKTPPDTWRQYGPLFRRYSTAVITPPFLAALAQVEAQGDPLARTYWRWALAANPFEIYRPASTAVGLYQITDPTFREARRYCIQRNTAVEEGCRLNALYTRVLPSHAVEMTAAYLHRRVADTVASRRPGRASVQQKQDLAAVIHLCGARHGDAYARDGFRLPPRHRCGDHDAHAYLARINAMKRQFARLAAAG